VHVNDDVVLHSLEVLEARARRRGRWIIRGAIVVVVVALAWLGYSLTESTGVTTTPVDVTAYAHTGVLGAQGLAAQGKYVWIADFGVLPSGSLGVNLGEKVVRVDDATGAATPITSPLFSLPLALVTTPHYVWVLNQNFVGHGYSLLRIDETSLAVTKVAFPTAIKYSFSYAGCGFLAAGGELWIPTSQGIVRVNTTTLAVSRLTSPLLTGGPLGGDIVADARYVWLDQSIGSSGSTRYLVRVSIDTGAVTKVSIPGFLDGYPIADDGTHVWTAGGLVADLQRFTIASGREVDVSLPTSDGVSILPSGLDVVANGNLYLGASLNGKTNQGAIVRVDIASGRVTTMTSPLMKSLNGLASANGSIWAVNGFVTKVPKPVLIRVSPHPSS
jgi:hypothetical protein